MVRNKLWVTAHVGTGVWVRVSAACQGKAGGDGALHLVLRFHICSNAPNPSTLLRPTWNLRLGRPSRASLSAVSATRYCRSMSSFSRCRRDSVSVSAFSSTHRFWGAEQEVRHGEARHECNLSVCGGMPWRNTRYGQ